MGATFASLASSAANAVRERAKARGEAENLAAAGTTWFCDEVEKEVDDLIEGIPAGADSRRLMRTVVDMAVLAAVEALFETRLLKEPAE